MGELTSMQKRWHYLVLFELQFSLTVAINQPFINH